MSGRISDELVNNQPVTDELLDDVRFLAGQEGEIDHETIEEICDQFLIEREQHRALVTELRALEQRMRIEWDAVGNGQYDEDGPQPKCTGEWHDELTSLLSAHDAQHDIQAVAAQANREGIIGIDFDAQQAQQYKYCAKCGQHLSAHCDAQQAEGKAE